MIGRTLAHYTVLDKLGEGGMGEVYLASDTRLERRVALKVLPERFCADPERVERFEREAKALAALVHPSIVTIFAVEDAVLEGSDRRVHFLVMELVEGRTLGQLIPSGGLPLDRLLEIAIPLTDALAAAHDRGVIHRDLKPANVMVTEDGRVKILDFGLAKLLTVPDGGDSGRATMLMTREGDVFGTYAYMSPEQIEGSGVDHRSDLFSLGIVLHEMATGSRPFRGNSPASMISAVLRDEPEPLAELNPELPSEFGRLVRRCLQKDRESRVQSAAEIRQELEELRSRAAGLATARTRVSDRPPARSVPAADAERRQLTMMFCSLVGAAALSAELDVEDLREILHDYQRLCTETVEEAGGRVAQFRGEGALVYFGYPRAQEDDAQRAVRAAMKLVARVQALNERLATADQRPLAARVGIHTGLSVVGGPGEGPGGEQFAIGETPNIAIGAQSAAEPDTVAITEATARLVRNEFRCSDLGSSPLEGVPRPVRLFRVMGEARAGRRIEAVAALTPEVGRDAELRLLEDAWAMAREGSGATVLLCGEAGIGKSRVIQLLQQRLATTAGETVECRCSVRHQNSPFYPWIDYFDELLDLGRRDSDEEKLRRLESLVEARGFDHEQVVPTLASILSLPLDGRYRALDANPRRERDRRLRTLLTWVCQVRQEGPTLFIVEDVHWADPSTVEFLALAVEQLPAVPVLAVLTFRPEFEPPWHGEVTQIRLSRLRPGQVESMVEALAGGKKLPPAVLRQIVERADGVPLFVEELTKSVLESRQLREEDGSFELDASRGSLAIPDTLQSSFVARLDRLGSAKKTAQLGAMLGRTFHYEALQILSAIDDETLQRDLRVLVQGELLLQRGVPPRASYTFRHALVQDAAYQSLLKKTRRRYHAQIAEILERHFSAEVEAHPELLAHHATEGGLTEKAMASWRKAARTAIGSWANQEAVAHLQRERKLLGSRPPGPERAEQELSLLMMLAPTLMSLKGWAAPDVEAAYLRARELCELGGESARIFAVLRGLWGYYYVRGAIQTARELGEDLLRRARELDEKALLVEANRALGAALFTLGEFELSKEHLDRALDLYDPVEHASHVTVYGQDPGVIGGCFRAMNDWYLGYPDRAVAGLAESLQLAKERLHPFTSAFALNLASMTSFLRREPEACRKHVDAAMSLASEHGFALSYSWCTIYRGWIEFEAGGTATGIEQMRQGLAAYNQTGAELAQGFFSVPLAQALHATGEVEEALRVVDEALAVAEANRCVFYEAELRRLEGEFLASGARSEEDPLRQKAEKSIRKSLDTARSQRARSLELRALVSLGHLARARADRARARGELARLLDSFTEGFETADFRDATALVAGERS